MMMMFMMLIMEASKRPLLKEWSALITGA